MRRPLALLALLLAAPLAAQTTTVGATRSATTTVILVRHAEKAAQPAADPPLTAAGAARAEALVGVVKDAGVRAIISTQFARTRSTVAPTAKLLGLVPEIVDARAKDHPRAVAAAIRSHRGQTVLVVGHSNTIPDIVAALGAPRPRDICDGEYDGIYVVTLPPTGPAGVTHARYGVPSEDTSCVKMGPKS
jgi:broad specificity phosphatase PhoE